MTDKSKRAKRGASNGGKPPTNPPVLASKVFSPRFVGLAGAVVCVIGLVGLSGALRYSLFGTSVTGKTIEFHSAQARSHSVIATVEVELPDALPFRWEVDDWLGIGDWVEGGAAPLRCAHIHSDHVSCLLDSPLEMYLQPLIFIVLGVGAMAYGARRARA